MANKKARIPRSFFLPELRRKGQNSIRSFSRKELATFLSLFCIAIVTLVWMIGILNTRGSTNVPVRGGTLREGIIGTPRFVNPVLAVSDSDKDLTSLVYSGLMRIDNSGIPQTDLAQSYEVSQNGRTYTFTLRDDIFFHNNTKVTANDVVYTISQIQNPLIDSPKKSGWQGITVRKVDEQTIAFDLNQAFSPFLELVTVGIMPSGLWKGLSPEEFAFSSLNINAIGSGPYHISSVNRNTSGIADEFILRPFGKFNLSKPYIRKLSILSFANERELGTALTSRKIDVASGLSPERAKTLAEKGAIIDSRELPRVFALFMNKNHNQIFNDPAVVSAVKSSINKQEIVDKVLDGYGVKINGPVPTIFSQTNSESVNEINTEQVASALEKAGWKVGTDGTRSKTGTALAFSISTADTPELVATADIIKENLEAIGFMVEVKIYSLGDLNQDSIRPRDYEALLFGEYVTDTGSLYAFWNSTQAEDPGLNVAMYKSSIVDKAFSELFNATDATRRHNALVAIESDIEKNAPVAFLYSPLYLEARRNEAEGQSKTTGIIIPSDRFRNVHQWYLETEKVWNFLIKN